MTARLPTPGGDGGDWGDVLNSFLEISLYNNTNNASDPNNGTLNASTVGTSQLASGSVTIPKLAASGSASGSNFLRGDGTWAVPNSGSSSLASDTDVTITSPSNNQALIYDSAASKWTNQQITESDVANLSADLGSKLTSSNNLSDVSNASTARTNLGLGTAATQASSAFDASGAAATAQAASLQKASNLSDLTSASTARTNLGLGSAATISSTAGGDLSGTLPNPTVAKIQGTTISAPTGGTTAFLNASGTWTTPSGSGNMNSSTYDPAGIAQQVVGTTATQTLTNKSISGSQITSAVANATTASTVTTIPALTGDVTSSGSSNATTLTSSSNVESIITANTTVAGALQKTNNLSDVTDAGTSRANLHVPALTPAAAVAVSNIASLSGSQVVDGYTLATGDLVLLTNQTTASQNGLWTVASGSWTRPTEFASGSTIKGRSISVLNGTVYSNTVWALDAPTAGLVIDSASQTWAQSNKSYNDSRYIQGGANSSITSLSGLTTPLSAGQGGTGVNTLTGLVVGNGTAAMTTVAAPAGTVVGTTDTQTISNKFIQPRTNTVASSATPAINTDVTDTFTITALAVAITSFTLTGTPVNGQKLVVRLLDNGTARAIAWGASFISRGATLPTTTVASKYLYVGFMYNSTAALWDCIAVSQEA